MQSEATTHLEAPRSVRSVVMLVKKFSATVGCLRRVNSWFLRCFRTLDTWDLASVGGRLACSISKAVITCHREQIVTVGTELAIDNFMYCSVPLYTLQFAVDF